MTDSRDAVLVPQNQQVAGLGLLGHELSSAGLPVHVVQRGDGERVPVDRDWRAVVVLGGEMGAHEEDRCPWLREDKQLLRRAAEEGTPVLGICLGAQILAAAMGSRTYPGEMPEVGYLDVRLTSAGRSDPILGSLDGPVLGWHKDTYDLPRDAVLLASSDAYPQAFWRGGAVGIPFHPEATPAVVAQWVATVGRGTLREQGVDSEELIADARRRAADTNRTGRVLLAKWVSHLDEADETATGNFDR